MYVVLSSAAATRLFWPIIWLDLGLNVLHYILPDRVESCSRYTCLCHLCPENYRDPLFIPGARIYSIHHSSQVLLPDYFPGNPYSELIQPVWCSYGLGARPVTVIAPDNGKIVFQLDWFRRSAVGQAIDDYWKGKPRIGTKRAHQEEDGIGSYITTTSSYITTTSSSHVSNEVTNTLEQLQGDAYAASQDGQRGVHEICISYPTCTRTA